MRRHESRANRFELLSSSFFITKCVQCKSIIEEAPHRAEKLTFKEAEQTLKFIDVGIDEAARYRQWFAAGTGSAGVAMFGRRAVGN